MFFPIVKKHMKSSKSAFKNEKVWISKNIFINSDLKKDLKMIFEHNNEKGR